MCEIIVWPFMHVNYLTSENANRLITAACACTTSLLFGFGFDELDAW